MCLSNRGKREKDDGGSDNASHCESLVAFALWHRSGNAEMAETFQSSLLPAWLERENMEQSPVRYLMRFQMPICGSPHLQTHWSRCVGTPAAMPMGPTCTSPNMISQLSWWALGS